VSFALRKSNKSNRRNGLCPLTGLLDEDFTVNFVKSITNYEQKIKCIECDKLFPPEEMAYIEHAHGVCKKCSAEIAR
jgi:Zn finger protein HypA/HybF involved in hydrogenase expression